MRHKIRLENSTIHAEQADVEWAPRYAHFHCLRHSETLGAEAIVAFLTHPAGEGNVATAMEKPANSAPRPLDEGARHLVAEAKWADVRAAPGFGVGPTQNARSP